MGSSVFALHSSTQAPHMTAVPNPDIPLFTSDIKASNALLPLSFKFYLKSPLFLSSHRLLLGSILYWSFVVAKVKPLPFTYFPINVYSLVILTHSLNNLIIIFYKKNINVLPSFLYSKPHRAWFCQNVEKFCN